MINISDAEFEIMKVIWDNEEISIPEIINNLENNNWSDNTIRTLIRRLKKKNAIIDIVVDGKLKYKTLIDKNEYITDVTKQFINQFYKGSISCFIEECVEYKLIKVKNLRKIIS